MWTGAVLASVQPEDLTESIRPLTESTRTRTKEAKGLYRTATRLIATLEKKCDPKTSGKWVSREVNRALKAADQARERLVERLELVRYLWRQADWLTSRFPNAELRDVPGLVKLVDRAEIEANDWSLTPGRYVGVVPEEEDEDFDFEETMRTIHAELEELNEEAVALAARIRRNFEELGI